MNIILGATGQVGSAIVKGLATKGLPIRAVIRNNEKADTLKTQGVEIAIADYFDFEALKDAIKDGDLIFLLTPETGTSNNVLDDAKKLLHNYRKAIESSSIKTVVGLSSIGAQFDRGTGNLLMSNMLEKNFEGLNTNNLFVRPAFYYSNWIMSLDMVKENGILPSFYPTDLKLHMISPNDVANFIAEKIQYGVDQSAIIEIVGPEKYSPNDIAKIMSRFLGKKVNTRQTRREEWDEAMKRIGFSDDAVKNFVVMTELVAGGKVVPEGSPVFLPTSFEDYLNQLE